jgi:hypothetical protein
MTIPINNDPAPMLAARAPADLRVVRALLAELAAGVPLETVARSAARKRILAAAEAAGLLTPDGALAVSGQ